MAFKSQQNLAVIGYAQGWTLWLYNDRNDTVAEMEKENYFQSIRTLVNSGDIIYLVGSDTTKQMYFYLENGNVKLKNMGE